MIGITILLIMANLKYVNAPTLIVETAVTD
jgi:hypothetical protein